MMEDSTMNNRSLAKLYYNLSKNDINFCVNQWGITNIELVDETNYSCVLKGISSIYGPVILKKRSELKVIEDEYHVLTEYSGRRFCKIYEVDLNKGILLEELITPGTVLKDESSIDKRLEVFCTLFQDLHKPVSGEYKYPTYLDWVSRIASILENMTEFKVLALHMKKAENICKDLFRKYPEKMLLHGDLHHYNILLNSNAGYTIIDPKGVIGNPIFDIPRFILNELEDEITPALKDKIQYCMSVISNKLDINPDVIKQCFYIETAMAQCWNVESNEQASIESVLLAKDILCDRNLSVL